MTKKVLFVCLGNICRSPMAEAYFRHLVEQAGLERAFQLDSAATSRYEVGNPPHDGTRQLLATKGITTEGMHARQITAADFEQADIIFGMDAQNVADLERLAPTAELAQKVRLFCSILPNGASQEIPDPYYTGNFAETFALISAASQAWLKKWQQDIE